MKEDLKNLVDELNSKVETYAKEIQAMEKMALKVDQESKDAERNLQSLLKKVQEEGLVN